jgi:ActR/RegA family two-component response regulator
MTCKNILIIEPDEFVSSLINKSFVGYDPNLLITASIDAQVILTLLNQQDVEIIIADATFLLEQPAIMSKLTDQGNQAHHTILTGYGSLQTDYPLKVEENIHFLTKPVDARNLYTIIEKILGPVRTRGLGHFSLSKDQFARCNEALIRLRNNINARCIMVSDPVGRVLISTGSLDGISSDTITSLLGGGLATLLEAGRELDHDAVLNLSYREGKNTDLYALNVGEVLILIIIIDKGRFYSKLGTVWYYARQTALSLESEIIKSNVSTNQPIFNDVNNETISDEIDRLINF